MLVKDLLCRWPTTKCVTKSPLNSLKVETELGAMLLTRLGLAHDLFRELLHVHEGFEQLQVVEGSFDLSYAFTCGILNLASRGMDVTGAVKGESV